MRFAAGILFAILLGCGASTSDSDLGLDAGLDVENVSDDIPVADPGTQPEGVSDPTAEVPDGNEIESFSCDLPAQPALVLDPADLVDFGMVGSNLSVRRDVTVRNEGGLDLVVTFVFPLPGDSRSEFSTTANFPLTVRPGESMNVPLRYQWKGGPTGTVTVTMGVVSNSPGLEQTSLVLQATPVDVIPPCVPSLEPGSLDFGVVANGQSTSLEIGVHNDGVGYCTFKRVSVTDCTDTDGTMRCEPPFSETISGRFEVLMSPSSSTNGIGPGETAAITVGYTPTTASKPSAGLVQDFGLLAVGVGDSMYQVEMRIPKVGASGEYEPNLLGQGVVTSP